MFAVAIRRTSWLVIIAASAVFLAVSPELPRLGIQARAPALEDHAFALVPFQLACIGFLALLRVGPLERPVLPSIVGLVGFWIATVGVIAFWVLVYEDLFLGLFQGRLAVLVLWKGTVPW